MATVLEQAMGLCVEEKLHVISALGDSMTENPENVPVPAWQVMVKLLLNAGAQVDGATDDGTTPLMIAAARGNLPIVQLLLDREAAPDRRDSRGWNAWASATEKGEDEVAALLARAGDLPEFPAFDE